MKEKLKYLNKKFELIDKIYLKKLYQLEKYQ